MEQLRAGRRIGEYVLEAPLGEGGGGSVWRAKHAFIPGRCVALKFPKSDGVISWLRKEGLLQAKLDHPNVVKIFGGSLEGDEPYIVLELVEGGDLRGLLARGPLSPQRAREVARGILEALGAAHGAGVVHGDLKPENVLLTRDGQVKLTDFGLARNVLEGELSHSLAVSERQVAGTLRYMPPELLERGTPSAKTDLYSFGVLLFELLVGRVPQGLERPADHGVEADDLDRLFQACYVPESRRVNSCAEALRLLEGEQPPPRGQLIQPRKKRKPSEVEREPRPEPEPEREAGFFARLFGLHDNERKPEQKPRRQVDSTPRLRQPAPAPSPRPSPSPPAPPAIDRRELRAWSGLLVSVASAKTDRGQWLWQDLDGFLDGPERAILALDLSGDQVDDADLALVGGIRSLQSLDLSDNLRVTDEGLGHLAHLGGLTYLSLRGCRRISDRGLGSLRRLRRLSSLDVSGCDRVTDLGLRHLHGLGQLKFLFLDGCRAVTSNGVDALKQSAPLQWVSFGS